MKDTQNEPVKPSGVPADCPLVDSGFIQQQVQSAVPPTDSREESSSGPLWDRRMRLDHILTWVVTGLMIGVFSTMAWVRGVDIRLHAVELEQAHQKERSREIVSDFASIMGDLKAQIKDLRTEIRDLSGKLDTVRDRTNGGSK